MRGNVAVDPGGDLKAEQCPAIHAMMTASAFHVVLDDLLGYPAESQHRDDDAASLVNLFRVLTNRYVKPEPDESD